MRRSRVGLTAWLLVLALACAPAMAQQLAPQVSPPVPPLPSSTPSPPDAIELAPILPPAPSDGRAVESVATPAPPPSGPPDTAELTDDTRGERIYSNVCGERIARLMEQIKSDQPSTDPLFKNFSKSSFADREILRALATYCGNGRFVLGQMDANQKCAYTIELTPLHLDLIRRLMAVRPEPADLIAIGCVRTTRNLTLWSYRANGILIEQSEIGKLEITGANIAFGVTISGASKIKGGVFVEASTLGRIFEVGAGSELGQPGGSDFALSIRRSVVDGLIKLRSAQLNGHLAIPGNRIEGDVTIDSTTIHGEANLLNNTVSGDVTIEQSTIDNELFLSATHSRALTIKATKVNGGISARAMKVDGVVALTEVTVAENVDFDLLDARRLGVRKSTVGASRDGGNGNFWMSSVNANSVAIADTNVANELFAGNTNVGAFDLTRVVVPKFNCTDCVVEQYMMLGGTFSDEVRLWGAQFKSQLRFREEANCAIWVGDPVLDLRGAQVATIAADYSDFAISGRDASKEEKACGNDLVRTLISGATISRIVPGLRRTNVRPADQSAPEKTPASAEPPPPSQCTAAGDRRSILDRSSDSILCWIARGFEKDAAGSPIFDPQPYVLVANALESQGRYDSATDIRIAKVTAEDRVQQRDFWYYVKRPLKILSYYVSGYGYHNEWAILWFLGLVGIGAVVFLFGRLPHALDLPHIMKSDRFGIAWYSFWFSVDRAVPPLIVDTTMGDYSILKSWARNYFYAHRAVGTLILTVALASLTGVFK